MSIDKSTGKVCISSLVIELERQSAKQQKDILEITGILLVNFGERGRYKKGVISKNDTPAQMIVKVINRFIFDLN